MQVIKDNYATFAVPYNGEDNNEYVDGKGFCCNDGSLEAAQTRALARAAKNNFQESDTYEKMQFYYHPDHLGSSSYITNLDGEVVQHIEYVPFGEVFVYKKLCFVVIVFVLSFITCNKHYIKYSACYKLPIPKTPFYPDAYKFVNTKEEFLSNMKLINKAIKVEAIIDTNKLDFNNHTYLFVFGAPIKKMYYSFKTTLFDDKSPSYAKAIRHKKNVYL